MNAMMPVSVHVLRPQLEERRRKLSVAAGRLSTAMLVDLLAEVDAALNRIDNGTFGRCETCGDPIEHDRLHSDPLVRFCLDHMNQRELLAHEQDIELATRIQTRLLPAREIRVAGWRTHYHYETAGPVGGDFCELTPLDGGKSLFFAIGDVAGKGVAASLLMAHLSAILRSLLSLSVDTSDILSRANRLFCEGTLDSHYATLVCGHVVGNRVEMSSAGHCPPLVVRKDGIHRANIEGLPLGLFARAEYPATHIDVQPGETMVLYTDGVTECSDSAGNQFSEERLVQVLRAAACMEPEGFTRSILSEVRAFRGAAPAADDITLLALRHES